jgi:hypothetical protein
MSTCPLCHEHVSDSDAAAFVERRILHVRCFAATATTSPSRATIAESPAAPISAYAMCEVCGYAISRREAIVLSRGKLLHPRCVRARVTTSGGEALEHDGGKPIVILSRALDRKQRDRLERIFARLEAVRAIVDRRDGERRSGDRRRTRAHQSAGRRRAERRIDQDVESMLRSEGWAFAWIQPMYPVNGAAPAPASASVSAEAR